MVYLPNPFFFGLKFCSIWVDIRGSIFLVWAEESGGEGEGILKNNNNMQKNLTPIN